VRRIGYSVKKVLLSRVRDAPSWRESNRGGRDVRDKWTKLGCGKPRSFLGKVVEQVGKQVDEAFEQGSR
jgi:hypothetical protein